MSIELLRCSVVSIVGIELSWLTQCTGPRRWTTSLRPENGTDAKLGPHAAQGGPRTEPINALKNINKVEQTVLKDIQVYKTVLPSVYLPTFVHGGPGLRLLQSGGDQ
jgi:hypothetical protein